MAFRLDWVPPASRGGVPLLVYRPDALQAGAPVVVCVHGHGRQPLDLLEAFAPHATAHGQALVLPLFRERGRYRQYQQLWQPTRRARADLALLQALDDWGLQAEVDVQRADWFGHSGGGQFVHRLALLHPHRVRALGISAAGWYTWPDPHRAWPLGLGAVAGFEAQPALAQFLRLPIQVWVGERDDGADDVLRENPELSELQGGGRMERAGRWVAAMRAAAALAGVDAHIHLNLLRNVGHDFRRCNRTADLAACVFTHFSRQPKAT